MPPPPNAESSYIASIRILPPVIGAAFLVGFIAAFLAAIWPAHRVAQIPLVDALRQNV